MDDRDHFAAAALTGLVANGDYSVESTPMLAWSMADAMLRFRDSRTANTTDLDAAPAARAAPSVSSVPLGKGLGTGDTFGSDAYRRFVGEVMNWISEATSIYEPRSDGGRRIMADACMQCWDAFNRIAHPTTNLDAAPAARARTDADTGRTDKAVTGPGEGTGDTPVTESATPDGYAYTGWPHPKGKMASISDAEIDALECVVEDGRIVTMSVYGRLRSLLVRLRPEWEGEEDSERLQPISDERLAALEQLSAMDQELELKYGIAGNPLIKAQGSKESAGAGITDAGPRLRQMNDVLEENERLRGRLAWTERERDSLRRSVENLAKYIAELGDEIERLRESIPTKSYVKNDEKRGDSPAKREPTQPRNGALREPIAFGIFSDGECYSAFDTQADADERADMLTTADPDREFNVIPLYAECPHCFVDATPQPNATPPQDSVQGEGAEPVAWAVVSDSTHEIDCEFIYPDAATAGDVALDSNGGVVPLYRHSQPTLTDAEREELREVMDFYDAKSLGKCSDTLRGLLERLK